VREFLLSNVRIPDKNWGDLNAVIAALGTAEARVKQAVAKWGLEAVREGRDALITYAETQTRDIIRTLPDVRASFEDYLEDDFVSDVPVRIKLVIEKDGEDGLHFDFTGSDPQVQAAFNLATNGRHPFLCLAMLGFFRTRNPGLPINAGLIRPFRFTAPEGTVVNARFPAATGVRYALTQLIFTIVQGALADLFEGLIPAAGAGQATIPAISMVDPTTGERQVTVIQPMIGGSGGRPWADGVEGCDISLGSLRNTPCEILEHEAGVRVLRYEIIPDSGGPGLNRGGSALRLDVRLLHPNVVFTARGMERTRFQPWGLNGGKAGACSDCIIGPDTANERRLGKVNVEHLSAGDVISLRTPGGGGYGTPLSRDPEKVLTDILDGLVSADAARAHYGVAICDGQVDVNETKRLRRRETMTATPRYDFGEGRAAYMRQFPAAVLDELSGLLAELPSSLGYRGKQVAFAAMRAHFGRNPVTPNWLRENWKTIRGTLFGN